MNRKLDGVDLVNQLISHEAVCRTAPATPGLLKSVTFELPSFSGDPYSEQFGPRAIGNWLVACVTTERLYRHEYIHIATY